MLHLGNVNEYSDEGQNKQASAERHERFVDAVMAVNAQEAKVRRILVEYVPSDEAWESGSETGGHFMDTPLTRSPVNTRERAWLNSFTRW
jgi:hypothetical protein